MRPVLLHYHLTPDVIAFSSTRKGGCSTGAYGEFNINGYCGDDAQHIARNREALCRLLSITDDRLIMPHQTHTTCVASIDEVFLTLAPPERQTALEGIDAVMTNLSGVCIGVSTADCIPILLYDPVHHATCAVHAGWRGTVKRIAEKAISAMAEVYGTQPADLMAQLGPGISLDSFEVGDEVYDAFKEAGFDMPAISVHTSKWHIDLPECNRRQLIACGVNAKSVALSNICTYKENDRFFSARRSGIHSGRIFTGILMK